MIILDVFNAKSCPLISYTTELDHPIYCKVNLRCVMANGLNCGFKIREFEL